MLTAFVTLEIAPIPLGTYALGVRIWIPSLPSGISIHWESISKCPPRMQKATARVLADAGFGSARVEVGWGNLGYYDLRNVAHANDYRQIFQALKDAGIRPLVLLKVNAGSPVPAISILEHMWQPARAGAREIVVDRPDLIRPGYTGANQYGKSKDRFSIGHRSGRQNRSLPAVCSLTARCSSR